MPTSYVVKEASSGLFVGVYNSVFDYELWDEAHISAVPVRTQAQCDTIKNALNAQYGAGKFGTHVRPH